MTLCSSSTKKGRFGPLLLEENDENVLECQIDVLLIETHYLLKSRINQIRNQKK